MSLSLLSLSASTIERIALVSWEVEPIWDYVFMEASKRRRFAGMSLVAVSHALRTAVKGSDAVSYLKDEILCSDCGYWHD